MLIQALGFCDGQISFTEFMAKYEGDISNSVEKVWHDRTWKCISNIFLSHTDTLTKENNEEQRIKPCRIKANSLMSAEDCFSQLEKRIKECHGVWPFCDLSEHFL